MDTHVDRGKGTKKFSKSVALRCLQHPSKLAWLVETKHNAPYENPWSFEKDGSAWPVRKRPWKIPLVYLASEVFLKKSSENMYFLLLVP